MRIELQPSDDLPNDLVTIQESSNATETQLEQLVRMFRQALLAASFHPDNVGAFFKEDQ